MAKGIFSFLFSDTSSGSETGSKNDGKGNAELVSMGNVEASNQIQLSKDKGAVKGKDNDTPEKNVAKTEKRKYKTPKPTHTANLKANRRRKEARKTVRTRTLEINDKTRDARQDITKAKKSTLNKDTKVNAIKEFLEQLPPDTKDLITEQMKQKIKPQQEEKKVVLSAQKQEEKMSVRERIERKRGAYREQQTALRLAKMAAEKAREMVKAVRDRILKRKPKNAPALNQNINKKQNNEKTLDAIQLKKSRDEKTK